MDFSDEMLDEILKIFQVESEEIISKLNNNLLDLEKTPNDKDIILALFRDAHSLKGASRMVGFNNVQTVAHKMEDILGLAKDNKILLNSNVVTVLYKTVDFLSKLIQKSINKKQEIYNEDIAEQIAILEKTMNSADSVSFTTKEQHDFDANLLAKNIDKINKFIPDCLFVLMKIEIENDGNLIKNLLFDIQDLYNIFRETGPYDIKKCFEDLKVKLEFITRASNSLTTDETEEIHQTFDNIIDKLISICEIYNLDTIDYYGLAFSKLSEKAEIKTQKKLQKSIEILFPEQKPEPAETQEIKESHEPPEIIEISETLESPLKDLGFIQDKIFALVQNNSSTSEIKNLLIDFEKNCDDNIKNILQIIIKIFDYAEENEIRFDEETISILKQSIEYCDSVMKNESEIADKELVLQRLEIIRQVLELNNENKDERAFVTKSKYRIKSKKMPDFSEIFDTGEIKTLRVDSSKLDVLVNQVNELAIAKIKTKKHLHELFSINEELVEWQRNSIKVSNYLKHYDKKHFQSGTNDNHTSFFIKQLLNLFTDNNKKVQEVILNMTDLQRTIQEDDMKINLAVDNLENLVKNIRVLPLAMVFHLFGRMVRDIALEKNKQIELEIIGSETTTDKKIIEEIKTPLIHIIRNAIDHGIETPEERMALGKNPTGKIILSACQVNNKVIIEIKDDGRGINLTKIKEKALQKGFLTEEELNSMSDEQITNIIFAPGFSTGEEITNISGRGIGLDVVQTKISQLNGRIKVLSQANKGCCVQIELPTTMSIVKAFLVKSSNQTFAIPMEVIKTVLRKKENEIISGNTGKSILLNTEKIPLFNLSDILNLPRFIPDKDEKNRLTVLVLENNDKILALCVDKLLGDQEILHKKLSAPLYKLKNISGITTLDTGEICFILNISDVFNAANTSLPPAIPIKTKQKKPNNAYKILLVDDSITTITLEKNILIKAGYNIEIAQNPLEAFDKMKINRFDLIISDIEMPEMDGLAFLEKLKTDEMFSDIPVIMLSSLLNEENKNRALELGAEKCINKNEFNQDELQETVSKILGVNNF